MASSNRLAREQKKPAVNKLSRDNRMREKAQTLFYVYYQMGADRSLFKLFEICGTIGVKISERSIENYSRKYEWQRQILELDNKVAESKEAEVITSVQQMNTRHAQVHQALLNIGVAGIRNLQNILVEKRKTNQAESLDISVQDIVRILDQAQKGERLARGEATSRTEVVTEVITVFVRGFALIFLGINSISDEKEREAEYLKRCDAMIRGVDLGRAGQLKISEGK